MKDKLREFLKTGTRKTVMRGSNGWRYPNGEGWGHSWNEEVVEFNAKKLDAALIDAEGDGGAVDRVEAHKSYDAIDRWLRNNMDDEEYAEYSTGLDRVFSYNTHPARSGVVSDEDAGEVLRRFEGTVNDGGVDYLCRRGRMRAALESYERNRK